MATMTDITTGVQTVTATGAVTATAGIDISAITGDVTICVEVISLTSAKTARLQLEDTTNAFTAAAALWTVNVTGKESGEYSEKFSIRKYQLPNNVFGTTSAKLRVNVIAIDSAATLALHAWLEQ